QPLLASGARPLDAVQRSGGVRHFSTGGDAIKRKEALIMRFFAILFVITSLLVTPAFAAPAYPVAVSSEVSLGDIEGLSLNEQEVQMRAEAILSARGWRLLNVSDDYQCPEVSFQFPRGWLGTREDRRRTSGNSSFFDGIFGG